MMVTPKLPVKTLGGTIVMPGVPLEVVGERGHSLRVYTYGHVFWVRRDEVAVI
jgi:hypothetical protein